MKLTTYKKREIRTIHTIVGHSSMLKNIGEKTHKHTECQCQ